MARKKQNAEPDEKKDKPEEKPEENAGAESSPPPPADGPVQGDGPYVMPDEEPKYSFPTKIRCPRCGVVDNVCYATHEGFQSRLCRRAICRYKWKVKGTPV